MNTMKNAVTLRIVATIAFAIMIAVNAMANLLPINELTTGEVSDRYPSLFTPAGITFSIWSVIYVMLLSFLIYSYSKSTDQRITRLLPAFIVTCVLNALWILLWHFLLPLASVVVMLLLLCILIMLFTYIQKMDRDQPGVRLFVLLPFTLYFAWICVATIANVSALLVSLNWHGGPVSEETWAIIMMAVAALLAWKVIMDFRVPAFGLVVVWALIGIFLRWKGTSYDAIVYASLLLILVIIATIGFQLSRGRKLL